MTTRRDFLQIGAGALAGLAFVGCDLLAPRQGRAQARRREVVVAGRRAKTVDVHAHCAVPEALALMNLKLGPPGTALPPLLHMATQASDRLRAMDEQGIDVEALSINPYWYGADRDLARQIIRVQNEKLAEACAAHPERFVAFATVALQYPELAAEQLEEGVKKYGLRGAGIGGSVNGEEISDPKFHPFWAKAEQLGVLVFIHPQGGGAPADLAKRLKGNGYLDNVIGNPLETTIALSHLIFEGTLDRFPGLKICAAHAGGYLPSYVGRSDRGCPTRPIRLPGRHLRTDQAEAVRVPEGDVLRHDGLLRRGGAAPRRRGGRGPADGRHRLSVSVDDDRGGRHPGRAGRERRRQGGHAGRQRDEAARDPGLSAWPTRRSSRAAGPAPRKAGGGRWSSAASG